MKRLITWKRVFAAAGGVMLIVAALLLLYQPTAQCGVYIAGRWHQPQLIMGIVAALTALLLIVAAWRLSEAAAKTWGGRMLTLGGSILITLIALDIALRLTDPPLLYPDPFYNNHDSLGYFFEPDAQHTFTGPDFRRHIFRTDENGLIIRTSSNAPRPDALRVLFIGDSFTEGVQVAPDENFSVVTAEALSADLGRDVQSINTGVSGYAPVQYLLAYRAFSPLVDPDVVVVTFYIGNDFQDDYRLIRGNRIVYDDEGQPESIKPVIRDGVIWLDPAQGSVPLEEVQAHIVAPAIWKRGIVSTLRSLLLTPWCRALEMKQLAARRESYNPREDVTAQEIDYSAPCAYCDSLMDRSVYGTPTGIFKPEYTAEDEEAIANTLAELTELADEVQADGRELLLVIMPINHQIPLQGLLHKQRRHLAFDEIVNSRQPQDVLLTFCAEQGLTCLDLLPVFIDHYEEVIYWDDETHLAPRGHVLTGETIAETLAGIVGGP